MFSHQEPRDISSTTESEMLISASLLIRDQKIVQEVSAEWGDIEETGEDAGREENVLEDYLEEERHRLFQSGSAYQCIFSHQKPEGISGTA
jgi:hypothetical protein